MQKCSMLHMLHTSAQLCYKAALVKYRAIVVIIIIFKCHTIHSFSKIRTSNEEINFKYS